MSHNDPHPTFARVLSDYRAPYDDPIQFQAAEIIEIDDQKKTSYPGWVWGTNQLGKSGWVPDQYLIRQATTAKTLCDYNAIELTVKTGELVCLHKRQSGFVWASNQSGQEGWIPEDILEYLAPGSDESKSTF